MGFTLRATLDALAADATVTVAELIPAVVDWNGGALGELAGYPLKDRRVRVKTEDVAVTLRRSPGQFDAVLLDVDNGPAPLTAASNIGLYDQGGIATIHAALQRDGVLAVWAAHDDAQFAQRLRDGGFEVLIRRVRGRLKRGGPRHVVFLGQKR
jgi:spermidine synthase